MWMEEVRVTGLDDFRYEHAELLRLIGAIIDAASHADASPDRIVPFRHLLSQAVNRHIAAEQAFVTRILQASAVPAHKVLSRRYVEELLEIRKNTTRHYAMWTAARIGEDVREFRMAVRAQAKLLRTRIDWEETQVFPVIEQLLIPQPLRRLA